MTVLYQSNFDSLTDGTPTGWTASAGSGVHCYIASTAGNTAVSGARVIGRNGVGDSANYTATGVLTSQAMRSAQINLRSAHMHRCGADATTQGYAFLPEFDGSSMRVRIFDVNGFAELGNSGFVLAFTDGDTLHFETSAIGTTLSARIWKNAESRPSAATLSVANSAYASGYAGVQQRSSSWGALDNVAITDGAGGEDYFYPEGAGTPSLVVNDGAHVHVADNIALTIIGTLIVSEATHAHAADSITLTAASNGTITIPAVRDWGTKALKTGQTGVQVDIRNITTGALVVRKTGQTTHATTGVCVVTDAAIVAGTTYEVVTRFADGSRGMWDYTAS